MNHMDNKRNQPEREETPQKDVEKTSAGDPQEKMQGPLSSLMHSAGGSFDTNETKEEADQEKEEKM
jgi:hypothetical protein